MPKWKIKKLDANRERTLLANLPLPLAPWGRFTMKKPTANEQFYYDRFCSGAEYLNKADLPLCGARCRDGHACRAKVVSGRQRCRNHGGCSTGPRTKKGKARIAASNRRRAKLNAAARVAPAGRHQQPQQAGKVGKKGRVGVPAVPPAPPRSRAAVEDHSLRFARLMVEEQRNRHRAGWDRAEWRTRLRAVATEDDVASDSDLTATTAATRPVSRRLPLGIKEFIVRRNARGERPAAVVAAVQTRFKVTISRQQVERYNPHRAAGRKLSVALRNVFVLEVRAQRAAREQQARADHAARREGTNAGREIG